jgi:hypothetical protein
MTSKHISYIFLAFIAILGWNVFLIKRDDDMYKVYYRKQAIENLKRPPSSEIAHSPKEQFCQSQEKWHPDCNVE